MLYDTCRNLSLCSTVCCLCSKFGSHIVQQHKEVQHYGPLRGNALQDAASPGIRVQSIEDPEAAQNNSCCGAPEAYDAVFQSGAQVHAEDAGHHSPQCSRKAADAQGQLQPIHLRTGMRKSVSACCR